MKKKSEKNRKFRSHVRITLPCVATDKCKGRITYSFIAEADVEPPRPAGDFSTATINGGPNMRERCRVCKRFNQLGSNESSMLIY